MTRISIPPVISSAALNSRFPAFSAARSQAIDQTRRPSPVNSSSKGRTAVSVRACSATAAPAALRPRAMALPMPRLDPVTRAVRPSSPKIDCSVGFASPFIGILLCANPRTQRRVWDHAAIERRLVQCWAGFATTRPWSAPKTCGAAIQRRPGHVHCRVPAVDGIV